MSMPPGISCFSWRFKSGLEGPGDSAEFGQKNTNSWDSQTKFQGLRHGVACAYGRSLVLAGNPVAFVFLMANPTGGLVATLWRLDSNPSEPCEQAGVLDQPLQEQPAAEREDGEEYGEAVSEHVAEKGGGLDACGVGDGLHHEIGSVSDISHRTEEDRPEADGDDE